MDNLTGLRALSALAQDTRLSAFRLLVSAEPDGILAGEIARKLDVPHNTLSSHLAALEQAGLVTFARQGRTLTYRANLACFRDLVLYLLRDCCGGKPELCAPLIDELTTCCSTQESACCD